MPIPTTEERIRAAQMEDAHEAFTASHRSHKEKTMTDEPKGTAIVMVGQVEMAPSQVIANATILAKGLADLINTRQLYKVIKDRKYVFVDGWTTLGAMLGVVPIEESVTLTEDGDYLATVKLIRTKDGQQVGGASALCGTDEPTWMSRPRYARRSMATTRATGKAFRLSFSWIMKLAGYEPTPAEEMPVEGEYHEEPEQPMQSTGSKWPREMVERVANIAETKHDKEAVNILNLSCLKPGDPLEDVSRWTQLYLFHRWKSLKGRIPADEPGPAAEKATAEFGTKVPGAAG